MISKKRFSMEKLGRDNTEKLFKSKGIVPYVRTLHKDELMVALKQKLLEESQEVFYATDIESITEELADIKEVVLSLMQLSGITENAVEEKRKLKKVRSGGFEAGTYFHFADIPLDCPDIKYFLENSSKYPEIALTRVNDENNS